MPAPGLANSQIIGGPNWIDSDRFDIQAKAEGDGGATPQDQMQLMVQSMLEDRFQLKAHLETRELPIDNLVVGKGGPKIKPSEDQTPPVPPAQAPPPPPGAPPPPERGAAPRGEPPAGPRGGVPFDPRGPLPRGAMSIMSSPSGITLSATAVPITTLVNMLQQQVGRIVFDQTDLKGLFDFKLQFSSEGLASPFGGAGPQAGLVGPGGPQAPLSAEPMPSLLTAIQDLGLRLESTKGPVDVLVIEGVQKPSEN